MLEFDLEETAYLATFDIESLVNDMITITDSIDSLNIDEDEIVTFE